MNHSQKEYLFKIYYIYNLLIFNVNKIIIFNIFIIINLKKIFYPFKLLLTVSIKILIAFSILFP